MRFLIIFSFIGFLSELPAVLAADDVPTRNALTGVWVGYAIEGKGEKPDQGPVKIKLTITKDQIAGVQLDGEKMIDQGSGTYTLDLSKPVHVMDATHSQRKNNTWQGIFVLEGDTLKWCVGRRERPTEFETKKGAFYLILKREQTGKEESKKPK
ncbi:MAG: TIGR03067 domain-containing protein [Zavarzinella sp.]